MLRTSIYIITVIFFLRPFVESTTLSQEDLISKNEEFDICSIYRGLTDEVIEQIKINAKKGKREEQGALASYYHDGCGVPQDYSKAMYWYQLAAKQGSVTAYGSIGSMYKKGEGVPKNLDEAIFWYTKLAELDLPYEQFELGSLYDERRRSPDDLTKAIYWYQNAANKGIGAADYSIALIYFKGQGIQKNDDKAIRHFESAAEKGFSRALLFLGIIYQEGIGVPQNFVQAHMWFNILSAEDGKSVGKELRELVAKKMTKEQIAEAQGLAEAWFEEHGQGNSEK